MNKWLANMSPDEGLGTPRAHHKRKNAPSLATAVTDPGLQSQTLGPVGGWRDALTVCLSHTPCKTPIHCLGHALYPLTICHKEKGFEISPYMETLFLKTGGSWANHSGLLIPGPHPWNDMDESQPWISWWGSSEKMMHFRHGSCLRCCQRHLLSIVPFFPAFFMLKLSIVIFLAVSKTRALLQ